MWHIRAWGYLYYEIYCFLLHFCLSFLPDYKFLEKDLILLPTKYKYIVHVSLNTVEFDKLQNLIGLIVFIKFDIFFFSPKMGFLGGTSGKEPVCQCRRHKRCGFDPWVSKIPWSRKWQPTSVFLSGKVHGQRRLAGCSLSGCKELGRTEHRGICIFMSMASTTQSVSNCYLYYGY